MTETTKDVEMVGAEAAGEIVKETIVAIGTEIGTMTKMIGMGHQEDQQRSKPSCEK